MHQGPGTRATAIVFLFDNVDDDDDLFSVATIADLIPTEYITLIITQTAELHLVTVLV